jgi:hypothetical protein
MQPIPDNQILTTRVGLKLPSRLTYDTWERAGHQIARIVDSSAWCLGDWLVYGQEEYTDRYRRAIESVGLDYQTLRNYAWVARQFELWRRREKLSFQHHAEVASLPPDQQDVWLDRAQTERWSRNQLRRHLRASRQNGQAPEASAVLPKLEVAVDRVQRWRAAAEFSKDTFENWMLSALDQAAMQALAESEDASSVA